MIIAHYTIKEYIYPEWKETYTMEIIEDGQAVIPVTIEDNDNEVNVIVADVTIKNANDEAVKVVYENYKEWVAETGGGSKADYEAWSMDRIGLLE